MENQDDLSIFSQRLLRGVVRLMQFFGRDPSRFGHNKDINLASLVETDFPIHASIPIGEVLRLKEQASACHASQDGQMNGPVRLLQRWMARSETFMRAIPAAPPPHLERDLFEGVELYGAP